MENETATEFVRLRPSTKKRLDEIGTKNESYDDIIVRLLAK